ncbi:MAG: hypothetical protein HOV80_10040 [Polyangiaceae bacterium]|nr:hypothetical protein [Polyangiaceae bacterium]
MAPDFEKAAELAGFFTAHAVWSVSDGETLVPLLGHEGAAGRNMIRFAAEQAEEAVRHAKDWLESNPENVARAVLVYDGFLTLGDVRKDALFATVVDYADPRRSLEIAIPYRPANHDDGFAVYMLKALSSVGLPDDLGSLVDAFFRGADAHEHGGKIWTDHLDSSF